MIKENEKTLEALRTALQMEIDGKEFYLKASRESKNELGRRLLESLAFEEDYHRTKFENIFSVIQQEQGWPQTDFQPDGGKRLRTIFSEEMSKSTTPKDSLHTEIETIQKAMDMESASRDFYRRRMENTSTAAEKQFYSMVADEEREHFLVLLDYFEYLKNPAAWFVEKEHPSLDGG